MPIKKSKSAKKTALEGITQDGPDRFLVRVDWVEESTGVRKYRRKVATSLAEAVRLRDELKGAAPQKRKERVRFNDYCERWLEGRASLIADSTAERYAYSLAMLSETFGQHYLDAIEPGMLREWQLENVRPKGRYSAATLNGYLRVLREMLRDASTDGVVHRHQARDLIDVRGLRESRTRGRRGQAYSAEQLRAFIRTTHELARTRLARPNDMNATVISQDVARALLTIAWTGMRLGEVRALKWSDIVGGEIFVARSVWKQNEKSTKTDDPRIVVVVEPLARILDEQRRWLMSVQHPGLESGLVFPASPHGARAGATRREMSARQKGLDADAIETAWYRSSTVFKKPIAKVVTAAKLPEVSPHSFRRTWENMLRRAGVDQMVRRSLNGWRSETAQAIYAGVDRDEREQAGAAVVRLVMGE